MKIKITINSVFGGVVWESEKETMAEAVKEKFERGANLRGANLRGADLYDANLRGANLRDANLRGANLRGANLRGANLRDANLRDANLRGANLRGANLRDANLRGANLRGADLYDANLRGANLRDANLRGANLYGANLYGADLRDADLRGANLRGADLYDANLYKLPVDFINQCSRDILFIFERLKSELPYFKTKLLAGEIDGSQYTGTCACLVGTLAHGDDDQVEKVCNEFIPFYEKGTQNMGETWFLNIRKGDTPETNEFAKHVLKLIEMVETGKYHTIVYTEEVVKEETEVEMTQEEIEKQIGKKIRIVASNK